MERLDEVVVCARLHGFYGAVHHVVGAHHEDDGGGILLLHAAQHFDAIKARQHDVEEREIGFLVDEGLQRIPPRQR